MMHEWQNVYIHMHKIQKPNGSELESHHHYRSTVTVEIISPCLLINVKNHIGGWMFA
jgi:hypothetical protein